MDLPPPLPSKENRPEIQNEYEEEYSENEPQLTLPSPLCERYQPIQHLGTFVLVLFQLNSDSNGSFSFERGAFGSVWKCSTTEGEFVALKVITKEVEERSLVEELVRKEVNMMSKLKHPGIVQMKESYETETDFYIAMDL